MTPFFVVGLALLSVFLYWLGSWWQAKLSSNDLSDSWWQTLLKLAYFIGLPYGTLISATVPATFFGLTGIAVAETLQSNEPWLGLAKLWLTSVFNLTLTWLPQLQEGGQGMWAGLVFLVGFGIFLSHRFHTHSTQPSLLEHNHIYPQKKTILFDYAHWSFYRALTWLLTNSLYMAVVFGGLLILLEYLVAGRIGRFSPQKQAGYLLRYGIGAVTSVLFLTMPNLWLTLLFQITLSLIAELLLITVQRYHRLGRLQTPSL